MACGCPDILDNSGNPVSGIPVKIGAPMSTLGQRFVTVGSIPQVLNYANFTLVDGGVVSGVPSNGGILSTASFFRSRTGSLYNSNSAQLAELCCDS